MKSNWFWLLLILFSLSVGNRLDARSSPEYQLRSIQAYLKQQENIIKALKKDLKGESLLSNLEQKSDELLISAQDFLRAGSWSSAIEYANLFLSSQNSYKPSQLLEVYYILGYSSNKLDRISDGVSYYLKFLSVLATEKYASSDHLEIVLVQLLDSAEKITNGQWMRLKPLLSSLNSLESQIKNRALLNLLLGIMAFEKGDFNLSMTWLNSSLEKQPSPNLRSRAQLYLGLSNVKINNSAEAKKWFQKISSNPETGDQYLVDMAKLNLARLHVIEKSYAVGLDQYKEIDGKSPLYLRALYEQVLVLWKNQDYDTCIRRAKEYLEHGADTQESRNLERLLPVILIRNGNLNEARKIIDKARSEASQIESWLRLKLDLERLSLLDKNLLPLLEKIKPIRGLTENHDKILNLYKKTRHLEDQNRRLILAIRSMLYQLGNLNEDIYFKQSDSDYKQLSIMIDNLINLANQLSRQQQEFFASKINESLKQSLSYTRKIRKGLIGKKVANNKPDLVNWKQTGSIYNLDIRLYGALKNLESAQARLRSIRYIASQGNLNGIGSQGKLLYQTAASYTDATLRGFEIVRAARLRSLLSRSRYHFLKKKITLATQAFYDDFLEFSKFIESAELPHERQMSNDIIETWASFESVLSDLFSYIDSKSSEERRRIQRDVTSLDELISRHKNLNLRIDRSKQEIMNNFIESYDRNKKIYISSVREHLAKLAKWSGDSYWQDMNEKEINIRKAKDEFRLRQTMLKSDLSGEGEAP